MPYNAGANRPEFKMIEFKNDAEIWKFLIDGGTVVEKSVGANKKKKYDL